jgi:hypothetical protein
MELERHRRSNETFGADHGRLPDPAPLVQNLFDGDVLRDDRHAAVRYRQAQVACGGRRRRYE